MRTPGRSRRCVALLTALALLAGCSARRPSVSTARSDYMEASAPTVEGTNTRLQGAALGALAGAALGAIAGAALGGGNAAGLGAAIGGGVGTAAGLGYAEKVVRDRQAYANASAYLAARGEALNGQIAAARRFNETLDTELGAARADQRSVEAAIEDAGQVRSQMRQDIERETSAVAESRGEGVPAGELALHEQRIGQLQAEETRLTAHLARLTDSPPTGTIEIERGASR